MASSNEPPHKAAAELPEAGQSPCISGTCVTTLILIAGPSKKRALDIDGVQASKEEGSAKKVTKSA